MVLIKDFYSAITLIELLVVIVILGILAGVAGPNLTGWTCKQEVRNDFVELNSFLTSLRLGAVNRNRTMMVRFSGGVLETYQGPQNKKKSCGGGGWNRVTDILDYKSGDSELSYTNTDVCFNADGSATSATYTVKRQCAYTWLEQDEEVKKNKLYKYRNQIFGTTGFFSKDEWNIKINDWEEM
jgi:prepilin-type N-terminal cleavage/methylation domain-containing protein